MPDLLLTGASGFLGGHLYAKAQTRWRVTATSHRHPLPGTLALDLGDVDACLSLVRSLRPRVILHAAAKANLDVCERDPAAARAINTTAVAHLLDAAAEVGARLILVSSDMVFDGRQGLYTEAAAVHPLSVYGETKAAAEALVLQAGGNHLVARAALIYGRPRLLGTSFSEWIERRLRIGEPVPLYTDQFRSPIWVENLADALLELAESEITGLLHLGGANRIDRYRFAQQLCRVTRYDSSLLQPTSMQGAVSDAPRPVDVSLDSSKAAALLHTLLLDTQTGLERMVRGDGRS
ncbi:MAG TPA: SDR family oxidoreductase [bacterium]|nr:SDR family oxidoreductase [bacterium]HQI48160.1 SDR family oxidoreductase [bacterium]HQJ65703.1 SDR family oxidoreductase [bacterium]